MSVLRKLCGSCLCYHCDSFVPSPEPFDKFIIVGKGKISFPSTTLENSQTQSIRQVQQKMNEEFTTLINRIIPETPPKRSFSAKTFHNQNETPSTAPKISLPIQYDTPKVIIHTRPASVDTKNIQIITPKNKPEAIKKIIHSASQKAQFINIDDQLANQLFNSNISPLLANSIIGKLKDDQQQPNCSRNLSRQFITLKSSNTKDVRRPYQGQNRLGIVSQIASGAYANPNIMPQRINVMRRKKVQRCILKDNRCLGIDLLCDKNDEVVIDQSGHIKHFLHR